MSNINTLFHGPDILGVPLYQVANNSISWILKPGRHKINVDDRMTNQWCGLIPIGHPACITTSGLKWNIGKLSLKRIVLLTTYNLN